MARFVFTVLGAGMQGTCAAYDLAMRGADEVRLVDFDLAQAERSAARVRGLVGGVKITAMQADASKPETLKAALDGCSALLSAVPYFLNPPIAAACIEAGSGYCDLGGNTAVSGQVLAMDAAAKARGVALVPDCGLAPGLGNTLAPAALARVPGATEVRVFCGGLAQDPVPPFGYHLVFAMEGLLNEYAGYADALRNGERVRVPCLDEIATVDFPGLGKLEAFATSGGTSTCPDTFAGKLQTYEYKTLRYPGHIQKFVAYRDAGLLSEEPIDVRGVKVKPRDVLATLLRPRLTRPQGRDLVALMVEARGPDGAGRWVLLDRFDEKTGFSAMERGTAYPAAVVAWMIAAGETDKGGVRLEVGVPPERFLEHLAARDLPLRWETVA